MSAAKEDNMERKTALDAVRDVAVEVLSVEPAQVTEQARFKEDLEADSLDLVELVMGLEEKFDIQVPEDELEGVTTVGHAVDLVLAKVELTEGTRMMLTHRRRGRVRVAVTGMGIKAPAGLTIDDYWDRLASGVSCGAPIRRWDASAMPVAIGCEVPEFDLAPYLPPKEARRLDRVAQLGFAAAADALADAGELARRPGTLRRRSPAWASADYRRSRTATRRCITKGPARVSPFTVPMMMANATPALVSLRFGWTGPNLSIATACAAGTNAIGEAAELIRHGGADVVVGMGAEACMTPLAIAAFARMTALSNRVDDPQHASRPFDADRDGFVMGEGAGALVLERWDRAVARGARIYAEIVGLRAQRRRVPHHRAVARRRGCRGVHAARTRRRRARARRDRPRQRARHVDAVERRGRGRPRSRRCSAVTPLPSRRRRASPAT